MTCIARNSATWPSCPCPECRVRARRIRKAKEAGLWHRIPNARVWAKLDELTALGWTSQAIASASGIPWPTVQGWLTRDVRTIISPEHSRRLLTHGEPTAGSVGSTGSTRRLRALARQGWDLRPLAEMSGLTFSTVATLRLGGTERVGVAKAYAVRDLYENLALTQGPSSQARLHATKAQWSAPLAWRDIDDPNEQPDPGYRAGGYKSEHDADHVIVERFINHADHGLRCNPAERMEILRRWVRLGRSQQELERETGWNVARDLREFGAAFPDTVAAVVRAVGSAA